MSYTSSIPVLYSLYRLGVSVFPFDRCAATEHFTQEMTDSNYTWKEIAMTYENGVWAFLDGRWHIVTHDTEIVLAEIDGDTFALITVFPIPEERWFRVLALLASGATSMSDSFAA
ncbi:MAG: hypothetical protein ACR2J8_09600 [Thermomicrobiales bacterium]